VIGLDNAVFTAEPADNFDHNYQYDTLGWTESAGLGGQSAYFANIFTAQGQEQISAVSFYTPVVDTSYRISVYVDPSNGPTGSSGANTVTQGTIAIPGYHTIRLDEAVPVSPGQRFSVVVELDTPGTRFPIAIESPIHGYSGRATAQSGQSFVSSDGYEWTDLTKLYGGSNVCLKVFTDDLVSVVKVTPTIATTTPTSTQTPAPTPAVTIMPFVYPTYQIPVYNYSFLEPVQNYSTFLFVYGAPTTPLSYIDDIGTLLPATSELFTGFISSRQVPPVGVISPDDDPRVSPVDAIVPLGNGTGIELNPGNTDPVLSGLRDPVQRPVEQNQVSSPGDENTGNVVNLSPQEYDSPQKDLSNSGEVANGEDASGGIGGFGTVDNAATKGGADQAETLAPEKIYLLVSDNTDLIPVPFMISAPPLIRISG
jgi:hypothetical protein